MTEQKTDTKKEMDAAFSVKLPKPLLEAARRKSKETGVTLSHVVRKAFEQFTGLKLD